jgi:hypothetical protein
MERFVFQIQTESGEVVKNLVISAADRKEAEAKLRRHHSVARILDCARAM